MKHIVAYRRIAREKGLKKGRLIGRPLNATAHFHVSALQQKAPAEWELTSPPGGLG